MSATQISALTSFTPSTTISSSEVNANFAAIRNQFNALINSDTTLAVPAGTGTEEYHPSGMIHSDATAVATTGTSPEVLATYALPTDTLLATGKAIRLKAWFQGAANTNSKTVALLVGSLVSTASTTASNDFMILEATIIRTGASTGDVFYSFITSNPTVAIDRAGTAAIAATWESASDISIQVRATTASASGDMSFLGWTIEYLG